MVNKDTEIIFENWNNSFSKSQKSFFIIPWNNAICISWLGRSDRKEQYKKGKIPLKMCRNFSGEMVKNSCLTNTIAEHNAGKWLQSSPANSTSQGTGKKVELDGGYSKGKIGARLQLSIPKCVTLDQVSIVTSNDVTEMTSWWNITGIFRMTKI